MSVDQSLERRRFDAEQEQVKWERQQAEARDRTGQLRDDAAAALAARNFWLKPIMTVIAGVATYFFINLHDQLMTERQFELAERQFIHASELADAKHRDSTLLARKAAALAEVQVKTEESSARHKMSLAMVKHFLEQDDQPKQIASIDFIIATSTNEAMTRWAVKQRNGLVSRLAQRRVTTKAPVVAPPKKQLKADRRSSKPMKEKSQYETDLESQNWRLSGELHRLNSAKLRTEATIRLNGAVQYCATLAAGTPAAKVIPSVKASLSGEFSKVTVTIDKEALGSGKFEYSGTKAIAGATGGFCSIQASGYSPR